MDIQQGYFSVLRWRPDATRDECRSLGVILINESGTTSLMHSLSGISLPGDIPAGGIVAEWLRRMCENFSTKRGVDLQQLRNISQLLNRNLLVTKPQPTAVLNAELCLRIASRYPLSLYPAPPFAGLIPKVDTTEDVRKAEGAGPMDRDEIELTAMRHFPEDFPIPRTPCPPLPEPMSREQDEPEPPEWVKEWDKGFYAIGDPE